MRESRALRDDHGQSFPHAAPDADAHHGLFHDALADWTNDDVLQTKEARTALGAKHPAGLRVLDWPELRALFAKYDPPATLHGRRDRRFGVLSVGLAALGLILAILSPLAIGAERYVEMVAAALVIAGLGLMAFHELGASSKARWLGQRFGAERVRALYFQAVANNLDLVARAMASDAALGEWKMARGRMLGHLPKPDELPGQAPRLARPVETTLRPGFCPNGLHRRRRQSRRRNLTCCCPCSAASGWTPRRTMCSAS